MGLGAPAVMSLTFMLFAFETHLDPPSSAIRDVEAELAEVEAEQDPLASHIFISRRHYCDANDTKGGKALRDKRSVELQRSLRAGFSGKFGRMAAVDGR